MYHEDNDSPAGSDPTVSTVRAPTCGFPKIDLSTPTGRLIARTLGSRRPEPASP
jgi:hypothetical protein